MVVPVVIMLPTGKPGAGQITAGRRHHICWTGACTDYRKSSRGLPSMALDSGILPEW